MRLASLLLVLILGFVTVSHDDATTTMGKRLTPA